MLGFPEDGPVRRGARASRSDGDVVTQDAYGRGPVQRTITSLRGLVRPATPAGPAVDASGRVVTTIFAAATSRRRTGFGVPDSVVLGALAGGARTGGHRPLRAVVAARAAIAASSVADCSRIRSSACPRSLARLSSEASSRSSLASVSSVCKPPVAVAAQHVVELVVHGVRDAVEHHLEDRTRPLRQAPVLDLVEGRLRVCWPVPSESRTTSRASTSLRTSAKADIAGIDREHAAVHKRTLVEPRPVRSRWERPRWPARRPRAGSRRRRGRAALVVLKKYGPGSAVS